MISTKDYNAAQEEMSKMRTLQTELDELTQHMESGIELEKIKKDISSKLRMNESNNKQIISDYHKQQNMELYLYGKIVYVKRCLEYLSALDMVLVPCCWDDYYGDNCNTLIKYFNTNGIQSLDTILDHGYTTDDIIGAAHIQAQQPFRQNRLEFVEFSYDCSLKGCTCESHSFGIPKGGITDFYINQREDSDYLNSFNGLFEDPSEEKSEPARYAIVRCTKDSECIDDWISFIQHGRYYNNEYNFTIDTTPQTIIFDIVEAM